MHLAIDALKIWVMPKGLAAFLGDQALHVLSLIFIAILFPTLWIDGLWQDLPWLPGLMTLIAGTILTIRAGGFAIGHLMQPWSGEDLPKGLSNGGRLIGQLERGMIFVLVLVNQPGAIGFLIAAKSILRFESTSKDQRAQEYVIIGTLASFAWALIAAYATVAMLDALPPLGILPQAD